MNKSETKKNNSGILPSTTVSLRYLRIAPRKVRLVADLIKNISVNQALGQLSLHPRRSAEPILKLLKSAIESANNKKMDIDKLIIKEIRVDKGPISKRWMPRAQGRSTPIHKVTSHVILTLAQSDKKLEPRFIIETKRPKKVKKEKKEVVAENKDRSSKIHHHPAPEKKTEPKEETRKEGKPERRGFLKRMFRRKSV